MPFAFLSFTLQLSWTSVWFWLLCFIGLVWLRRHFALNRAGNEPALKPQDADGSSDPWPRLTVLVAGKDEEDNVETCATGLLSQDYPGLQIIAINDRSDDRTGEILDRLAGQDPRLSVVHVHELPAGWAGKNHAMHQGQQQATGEWLCFTDADCRFHTPRLLSAAVRFAQRNGLRFLSVLPELETHTFWERVIQPPAGAIMVFWFPPEKVNDPRSRRAYANGAFMLMTREAYDELGGHTRVKAALNEDMHFARLAKLKGIGLRVIQGGGLYTVHMYSGLRQIWKGWSRIFYGCFRTWARLIVSAVVLGIFSVFPFLSLLLSPLLGPNTAGIAAAAAFTLIAQQTILWRFYPLSGMARPWALTYPLGSSICLAMVCNAMTRLAGLRTQWRGTTYPGGA